MSNVVERRRFLSDNYRREIFSMTKAPSYLNFVLAAAAIVAILFHLNNVLGPTIGGDTEWYIAAANGHLNEIIEPYSGRFLHPFLVGSIAGNFSITVEQGFLIIGIASVFLFFLINALLLKKILRSSLLLFPLFLTPYFFNIASLNDLDFNWQVNSQKQTVKTNQLLVASVTANGSQNFKLDMRTPSTAGTETNLGSQYSTNVTIVASAP